MDLLILDDAEADLATMVKVADTLGHDVDSVTTSGEFREVARSHPHDVQVVDYDLPDCTGPELVAVTGAKARNVPTIFLTNYKPDCEQDLADLDPRLIATTVAKPPGMSPPAWKRRLSDALDELMSKPNFDQPEPIGVPTNDLRSDFFSIVPGQLDSLADEQRDPLEDEICTELHPHLLTAWEACEDDWLMMQCVDDTVLITERGIDGELPSTDAVRNSEIDRGSTALMMGRPTVVEETTGQGLVDCTPDHKSHDWRRYPFVRLVFPGGERDFHLDTGSSTSYISREFLAANTEMPRLRPKRHVVSDLSGRELTVSQLPVNLGLHVSGPDGNVELSVMVQAVKDWRRATLLNPPCEGQRCPGSLERQCGRRLGLIGRDMLYRHSQGGWQFDTESGQFYALEA